MTGALQLYKFVVWLKSCGHEWKETTYATCAGDYKAALVLGDKVRAVSRRKGCEFVRAEMERG